MNKKKEVLLWAALGVVTLVGLWALGVRMTDGLKVSRMTSVLPWGLWVSLYIYFIGLSAGSFLLSTLVYVFGMRQYERVGKLALYCALLALYAGVIFILIDLGRMDRFWTVFVKRNLKSVLEWEIHFYILYIIILMAELWLLMRTDLARLAVRHRGIGRLYYTILSLGTSHRSERDHRKDLGIVKILGIVGVPTAIAVHGGTGAIFAVVKARPFWFTGLFPVIFLVSALASGAALLTFITAFFGERDEEQRTLTLRLGRLTGGLIGLDLFLLMVESLVGLYGGVPMHVASYKAIIAGPFWFVFWIIQFGLGALVPLVLVFGPATRGSVKWLGVAGLLVVVGIVGVRLNIVIPALSVLEFKELAWAFVDPRMSNYYFPSLIEWLSSLGVVGFFSMLFGLGMKLLPLMREVPQEVEP